MSARPRRRTLGASFVLLAAACGPSAEQTERDRVLSAVDELRASNATDTATRRELIRRLREQTTTTPAGARARDTCARAYDLLTEANELEAALQAEVSSAAKVDPAGLAARFRRAEDALEQSRGDMVLCERASTELRLRK